MPDDETPELVICHGTEFHSNLTTRVPRSEFKTVGRVEVHATGTWHLRSGEVIEMYDGRPVVDASGDPLVLSDTIDAAEEE